MPEDITQPAVETDQVDDILDMFYVDSEDESLEAMLVHIYMILYWAYGDDIEGSKKTWIYTTFMAMVVLLRIPDHHHHSKMFLKPRKQLNATRRLIQMR